MKPQDRVIATAAAQVGYLEKKTNSNLDSMTANAGNGNFNKFAAFLDSLGYYNGRKNGFDYCDVFSDYCFIYTFGVDLGTKVIYQPLKSTGAGTKYSRGFYQSNNALYFDNPQPGDQAFFYDRTKTKIAHTGLVEFFDGKIVHTIEGNTTVKPGQEGVARKTYSKSYAFFAGFGRPNWKLVEEEEAKMAMTQAEFNKMFAVAMAAYEAEKQDRSFQYSGNEAENARRYCIQKGLIRGAGKDSNGNIKYMWQDDVTREQLSLVLYRQALSEGRV